MGEDAVSIIAIIGGLITGALSIITMESASATQTTALGALSLSIFNLVTQAFTPTSTVTQCVNGK